MEASLSIRYHRQILSFPPNKGKVKIQNKNEETYAIDSMNPNMQSQPKDGDNVIE